jgi:hypothetical protein
LADKVRLRAILERAGFKDISINSFDFPVCFANKGGVDEAVQLAMQIGPSGSALAEANNEIRAAAAERLKATLAQHDKNGRVKLGGAASMVEAVRSQVGQVSPNKIKQQTEIKEPAMSVLTV